MKTRYSFLAGSLALILTAASARGQVAIQLVPVSADAPLEQDPTPDGWSISGNEITMESGGRTVWLEIRIGDWDPDDTGVRLLRYWVEIDEIGGYSSGFQGTLARVFVPCTSSTECVEALGTGSGCPQAPGLGECMPGLIDRMRNDYVFFGTDYLAGVNTHINISFGGHVLTGAVDDPVPFPSDGLYGGTFMVVVPADSAGTFTLAVDSGLSDQNDDPIPVGPLVPAKIAVGVGQCCYAVNTEQPECIDAVTRDDCYAQQEGLYFVPGNTCADECLDCLLSSPPTPAQIPDAGGNLVVSTTNRFLSFSAGDRDRMQAARVTFVDLPAPYDIWNGSKLWVGAPSLVSEDGGTVDPQEIPPRSRPSAPPP